MLLGVPSSNAQTYRVPAQWAQCQRLSKVSNERTRHPSVPHPRVSMHVAPPLPHLCQPIHWQSRRQNKDTRFWSPRLIVISNLYESLHRVLHPGYERGVIAILQAHCIHQRAFCLSFLLFQFSGEMVIEGPGSSPQDQTVCGPPHLPETL